MVSIEKFADFELFVPIVPVPKSYRVSRGKQQLGEKCRKYQYEVTRIIEKHKPDKPFDDALWVEYTFYMDRPLNAKNEDYPKRKPDHDNLVKSLQDCLERAGVVRNDSRIVTCVTKKVYCAGKGSEGICQPGIQIRLGVMV